MAYIDPAGMFMGLDPISPAPNSKPQILSFRDLGLMVFKD